MIQKLETRWRNCVHLAIYVLWLSFLMMDSEITSKVVARISICMMVCFMNNIFYGIFKDTNLVS